MCKGQPSSISPPPVVAHGHRFSGSSTEKSPELPGYVVGRAAVLGY